MNLIDAVLWLPLFGFFLTLITPKESAGKAAFALAAVAFALSLLLVGGGAHTDMAWIPSLDINYRTGVDGLSLWLVILTTLLTPIAILASWGTPQPRTYYALILLLEFAVIGVFAARDMFLYYVFWELTLVPALLLIGMFGGHGRREAAVKFFIYTMAGSLLMLAAMVFLYVKLGTWDYSTLVARHLQLKPMEATLCFAAFFIAFAIKTPIFPLHTWLPDAYTAAPTPVTILLAGLLSKMGTYSLVRYCLPLFPDAARDAAGLVAALAITGILWGALVALVQPNMKRLIAYSSVSHLGFVVLGIFSFRQVGLDGAIYQMVAHGISTGALFLMISFLEQRRHSQEIRDYGGVATIAPWFTTIFMVATFTSAGLPLLANFVGEFMILQGAALANIVWAGVASLGVILSACYMLWMVQRVFFGPTPDSVAKSVHDLKPVEWAAVLPLTLLMIWLGISTQALMSPISEYSAKLLGANYNVTEAKR
jgi:NADH-quinone oxidoreductase subunit M